jgi:DNA-binding LytR/AlgR family response regulator
LPLATAGTQELKPSTVNNNTTIFLKVDGEYRQIAISDIIYVSGMKDYVMFYLDNERRPLVTHLTMKAVEEMLPTQQFMRVHRSFIVCLDKIRKVDRNDCIYIGEEIIHVTEAYLPAFQQYLTSKFPGK